MIDEEFEEFFDEETLEEQLANLAADLVTCTNALPFIHRLFAQPSGTWHDVEALCEDIPIITDNVFDVTHSIQGHLKVTWLPYQGDWYNEGFVCIIFFQNYLLWNTIAVYNKALVTHS